MNTEHKTLKPLFICGPTASGKSSLALEIATACNGEIVNADAFQLYQGLETLTAAPNANERRLVPHHLYSTIDPAEPLDAATYRQLALPVLRSIQDRGKRPLVVGGSGLYLKFLTHGPSDLPSADPQLRAELEALSLDELVRRLDELDPVEAAQINRQNPRYVQRALEICLLTGRPASQQRASFQRDPEGLRGLLVTWNPEDLEQRIRLRTKSMLDHGAINEVATHPNLGPTASKAIGVREIRSHLAGTIDRDECEKRIVIATRQYAKRQRNWFRREQWLTPIPGNSSPEESISIANTLLASAPDNQ